MAFKIGYLMDQLYNIDKNLGGNANLQAKKKGGDDFMVIKDILLQNLHSIRAKIKEKEVKGRSADTIRLEIEIQDKLGDSEKMLIKMNQNLRKQAKNPKKVAPAELQRRQKLYDNFNTQIRDIKLTMFSDSSLNMNFDNNTTLTDLNAQLLGDSGKGEQRPKVVYEMTQQEKDAIERWKQEEQLQDEQLDQINKGVLDWKKAGQKMGDAIDQTIIACQRLEKEIDKTNLTLESSNQQLQQILHAYRQPNKLCLDFVLLAILLGLVVMLYYTAQK